MMLILILTLGLHLPMMSTPIILPRLKAWKKFQKKKQVKPHLITKTPQNQVRNQKRRKINWQEVSPNNRDNLSKNQTLISFLTWIFNTSNDKSKSSIAYIMISR